MPAAIYARFSSSSQREESIETQIRECTEYAKAHGLAVGKVYEDHAKSARTASRPAFQRMIRDAERGAFTDLIVYTLDRFARNRIDSAMYKQRLGKAGVKLHYAKQDFGDGPESILIESMLEGYAEYYSASLSRGVKAGMLQNAINQKTSGGSAPLGYRHDGQGHYEVVEDEARLVRMAFDLYEQGMGYAAIARKLSGPGLALSARRINGVIKNPRYTGTFELMGQVVHCPPIVDKAQWERCNVRAKTVNRTRNAAGRATVCYWLSGKVFCGLCGSPMIGESGRGKNGEMHYYYKCSNRKRKRICGKKTEQKDYLEQLVMIVVERDVLHPDVVEHVAEETVRVLTQTRGQQGRLAGIRERLKETERGISGLLRAVEMGTVSEAILRRLEALERTAEELRREEQQVASLGVPSVVAVRQYLGQCSDPAVLLGGLVSRVRVYDVDGVPDTGRIEIECDVVPDRGILRVEVPEELEPVGVDEDRDSRDAIRMIGHGRWSCSDKETNAPPYGSYPNPSTMIKFVEIEDGARIQTAAGFVR